jgi:hypothetical protein
MATVPGREDAVRQALASLRPQVERIHVVCNGFEKAPAEVLEFADVTVCDPSDSHGSAAKLAWSRRFVGLYLGVDDDFAYPPDYVETMKRWVKRWRGRALVVCHGRVLKRDARRFEDVERASAPQQENTGGWLNYPGACGIAFDSRLDVPDVVPGKNLEEVHLAEWAQLHRVPVWLVPHPEKWLRYLLEGSKVPTIWEGEKRARFANRNAVIAPRGTGPGWQVYK